MRPSNKPYPDFESRSFLESHIEQTLNFYRRNAHDPGGGFFHCFRDDGTVYDKSARHLVSSARFVVNFATAFADTGNPEDLERAQRGLKFLAESHRQPGGWFAWELNADAASSPVVVTYGHAFVLLAAASAARAGIPGGTEILEQAWGFCESNLWREGDGAYVDELPGLSLPPDRYRGQNANMHMCEACLSAWLAIRDAKFLGRAKSLAKRFALELANECGGQVWEHYSSDWTPDLNYNREKPDDLFKPWGFQPGHQFEWSRLLLMLERESAEDWYLERAISLFGAGWSAGFDDEHGGVAYGVSPNGGFASGKKYYWVQSEGFAAAWRLYRRTGIQAYREHYNELWRYSWDNLVDHEHGAWFRVLERDGSKIDDLKSPPGKTDYHTVMTCWDVMSQLG